MTIDSQSCITHDEYIYIFGGFLAGETAAYSNKTFKFTAGTDTLEEFETTGTRPDARSDHSASIMKDSMYIFGGVFGEKQFNDIWKLNFA